MKKKIDKRIANRFEIRIRLPFAYSEGDLDSYLYYNYNLCSIYKCHSVDFTKYVNIRQALSFHIHRFAYQFGVSYRAIEVYIFDIARKCYMTTNFFYCISYTYDGLVKFMES